MRVLILGLVVAATFSRCPLSPVGKPIPFQRVAGDVPYVLHAPRDVVVRRADGSRCLIAKEQLGGVPYSITPDWARRREVVISVGIDSPNRYEFWRWNAENGVISKEAATAENHGLQGMASWGGEIVWLDKVGADGDDCTLKFSRTAPPNAETATALCQGGVALTDRSVFFTSGQSLVRMDRATGIVEAITVGSRPAVDRDGRLAFFRPNGAIEVRNKDATSVTDTKQALELRHLRMETNPRISWSSDGSLVVTILQRGYAEQKVCEGFPCFESYILDAGGTKFLTSGIISGSPIVLAPKDQVTCPEGTEKAAPIPSGR